MTTRPKGSEDIDRPLIAADDIAIPGWAGVDATVATSSLWQAARALPRAVAWITRLGWRVSPPMVILVGLLYVLSGLVTATGLLATVNVFTAVLEQGPTPQRVISALPSLAVVALAYGGRAILEMVINILEGTLRPKITQVADNEATAVLARSTLLAFDDADFRELAAQGGRGGVHAIETSVAHVASLLSSATAVSVGLITVGLLNPWLPAVLLLPILVDGWTAARIARLNYQNFLDTVTHNMRKAVIEEAVTDRGFALERHALTLQERLLAEYRGVSGQLTCEKAVLARRSALARTAGRLAAGMATLLAYAALAYLLYLRVMPLALAGTTVVAMQTASMALKTGMHELNALYENSFRMDFYRQLMTSAGKRKARVTGHSAPRQPETIRLDSVGFTYPGQRQPALVDINLVVRRGETIALVGENGSGKSTLAKLITGLYEPTSGSVYWDATDLATVDEQSIHQQIAIIAQDPTCWPTTAINSVLLGTHQVDNPVDRWRKATSSTGVDRIIATLPHGGNTLLSKRFRNGHELSGGQWQRFGVARGIHRRAHILVADEPTSALDADAESRVFTTLHQNAEDHQAITILVTHRLANLVSATRIVVLDHGRIAESGTHEELLALGGQYRRLFDIQARAYRTILDRPDSTSGL